MEISRVRKIAGSASLVAAAAWLTAHCWGHGVPALPLEVGAFVIAGVGLSCRSMVAQVLARGAAWLMLAPSVLAVVLRASMRGQVDRLALGLALGSGAALLFTRPMLHTAAARAAFDPIAFRRALFGGATASAAVGLGAVIGAVDLGGAWAAPLLALGAALLVSAVAVVRMRAWGLLLGCSASLVALASTAFARPGLSAAFAMAAVPGIVLALLIALARLGAGRASGASTSATSARVTSDFALEGSATLDADEDDAEEPRAVPAVRT